MEKIDRELLIKEISTRLPYGVKAKVWGWDEDKGEVEVPLRIYSINTDGYVYFETNGYDVNYLNVDDCLLYLRPMSSMTGEEFEEYGNITEHISIGSLDFNIAKPNAFDWLNEHHFDMRNLIEKGLAIDCTGLNIY